MFETVDIQNTNEGGDILENFGGGQTAVENFDQPVEQARVDVLCDRVTNDGGLLLCQVGCNLLTSSDKLFLDGPFGEALGVDAKQLTSLDNRSISSRELGIGTSGNDFDVSDVQQSSEDFPNGGLLVCRDTDSGQGLLCVAELLGVVQAIDLGSISLVEVIELFDGDQLVEDVVVPLLERLENQSRALEQVYSDSRTNNVRLLVKHDLDGWWPESALQSRSYSRHDPLNGSQADRPVDAALAMV
ncbi:class V myosin, partial [Aureobasidium sp. EXF-3399]